MVLISIISEAIETMLFYLPAMLDLENKPCSQVYDL